MNGTELGCSRKQSFDTFNTARKHAVMRVMSAYKHYDTAAVFYAYRCYCGNIHLTSRKGWDGKRHIRIARLRPPRLLVERAYAQGVASSSETADFVYSGRAWNSSAQIG